MGPLARPLRPHTIEDDALPKHAHAPAAPN